jgi:DNA-binding response OmpR family regulator
MAHILESILIDTFAHLKMILLVADEHSDTSCLTHYLSQNTDYHIFVATSGFAAIKFLRHIAPHLLIVDYCLPDMTGIQLFDYLHANHKLTAIPAIMLSASWENVRDELEMRKLMGVSKPFNLDELIASIESLLASSSREKGY